MHMRTLLIIVALALPCIAVAAGQAYRWTDANGVVHFSEERPPAGVEYSVIDIRTGAARQVSPQDDAAADADGEPPAEEATPAASALPQPEEVEDTAANRDELCTRLADNIRILESEQAAVLGDRVLSEDERSAQLASARAQQADFCSGD